jgi:hypothetical protein
MEILATTPGRPAQTPSELADWIIGELRDGAEPPALNLILIISSSAVPTLCSC